MVTKSAAAFHGHNTCSGRAAKVQGFNGHAGERRLFRHAQPLFAVREFVLIDPDREVRVADVSTRSW